MLRQLLLCIALVLTGSFTVSGQPGDSAKSQSNTAKERTEKELEAERIFLKRRADAQSLLITLAADARNFSDSTLRARTLARVAYVLWTAERERSRTLFRAAWEAAELADAENARRSQEEIKQQQAKTGSGGYALASPPNLKREVLSLAARRDRSLGEEFLDKGREPKAPETQSAEPRRPGPLGNLDAATFRRLALARELLDADEVERAIEFADPALAMINWQAVDFLSYLRERNPAAADQRYAAMLANMTANPQADANTVSLLASYLFTPHRFVAFSREGTYTNSSSGAALQLPEVAPEMRLAFFRAAASVLLRPLAPPGQESTSAGHDGHYLIIKRLLPLFEQYAPVETTAALRAQLEALTSLAGETTRQRDDDDFVRSGIRPDKFDENWETSLLNRLDRAKTAADRDQIRFQIANFYAAKGDLKAREYVNKIDDMDTRNLARAYIDASLAIRAIERKKAEDALEIARIGDLTHVIKSWLFAQTAKLLAKTDRERASALIDEAAAEAGRIQTSDPDRPRAFLGVTNAQFLLDPKSAWDVMDNAIRAANSANGFTGEDGQLTNVFLMKGSRSVYQTPVADFDVNGIFEQFAKQDFEKAVELAGGFQKEAPRAVATIAIARAVFEEKKK